MLKRVLTAILLISIQGCSFLTTFPDHLSQSRRFGFFKARQAPVKAPLHISWDQHSIPFVTSENDEDLAFGVGAVHAHLRLGQIELLRYLSHGRLTELTGPIRTVEDIDRFMRTINFIEAAENSMAVMSEESRIWIRQFTLGLNWYIEQLEQKPVEHRFFNIDLAPYSEQEVMTIIKLVGADLSWFTYLKYLALREIEGWEELYRADIRRADLNGASCEFFDRLKVINLIKALTRSGSNALVIAGSRTKSGAGMIASDPHVGLFLPNFWLLMGMKSPGYHAIGFMIPGVPFIAVGRNRDIAWGGTNMRGISSHLYRIPRDDIENMGQKRITYLKRRWWYKKKMEILETNFGPAVNDGGYFKRKDHDDYLAMDWIGHRGSDEILAFLKVAKAGDWNDFRSAFETYSVSAMNMLFTDAKGNIGMVPAYGQPVLKDPGKTLDLIKEINNPVVGLLKPTQQPNPLNPAEGFIASANNKPFAEPVIPYAFSYSNSDRVDRLKALMETEGKISVEYLMSLQQDVFSARAVDFKRLLLTKFNGFAVDTCSEIYEELCGWDGKYDSKSKGAVVFEVVKYYAWQDYIKEKDLAEAAVQFWNSYPDKLGELSRWVESKSESELKDDVRSWMQSAAPHIEKYPSWGKFQVQPQTTMLGMVPVIGKRFEKESYPAQGGEETLNKSGRKFSPEASYVTYGASARHISDMSSLDENYFVLHGGQDGWIFNDNIDDQTTLWRNGRYINLPMTMNRVEKVFNRHKTRIEPLARRILEKPPMH